MPNEEGQNTNHEADNITEGQNTNNEADLLDEDGNKIHVSSWKILFSVVSIVASISDVVTDFYLAYSYSESGKKWNATLTLLFVTVPTAINTFLSLLLNYSRGMAVPRLYTKQWIIVVFGYFFHLAPVLWYCEYVHYAIKSRLAEHNKDIETQRLYYEMVQREYDSNLPFFRVLECLLEAVPQLILQLAIVLRESIQPGFIFTKAQAFSIITSILAIAWAMATYELVTRNDQLKKFSKLMVIPVLFLWHFFLLGSRIISITALASCLPITSALACLVHWIIMIFWLDILEAHVSPWFSPTNKKKYLCCVIFGLTSIFIYLLEKGSIRCRHILFYIVYFVENVGAITIWAVICPTKLYYILLLVSSAIVSFIIGIGFMTVFFKCMHAQTLSWKYLSADKVQNTVV